MDERWIVAIGLVAGGIVVGAALAWVIRRWLGRASGGDVVAGVAAIFAFWFVALFATVAAIALVEPATLENLPRRIIDYSPRLLVAGVIIIGGYALAVLIGSLVGIGLERASGRMVRRISALVRWGIFGAAVILALAQLGVDTTILIILTAVAGSGVALAGALLVGLGGRQVAAEIAAGRYLSRFLARGTKIEAGGEAGRVAALHPATVELELADGRRRHVPYTRLLDGGLTVGSPADPDS